MVVLNAAYNLLLIIAVYIYGDPVLFMVTQFLRLPLHLNFNSIFNSILYSQFIYYPTDDTLLLFFVDISN